MENTYFDSKEFKEHLRSYETMMGGGDTTYLDSEELTDIAEYYHSVGRIDDAVAAATYATRLFAGATAPLVFLARLHLSKGEDTAEAECYVDQIDDHTDLDYYYIRAEVMMAKNDAAGANAYLHTCYEGLTDEEDRCDFVLDVATLFADYDQMDYSYEWLQESSEPECDDYQEALGRIQMSRGNYAESERIFTRLLDNNPFSAFYWNQLSASQFMQNDIEGSIASSEYAIAINPNNEEALLNKANGLLTLNHYEGALAYYAQYSQLHPEESVGDLYQGICLLNLNRPDEAIAHLRLAEAHYHGENEQYLLETYQELAFSLSRQGHLSEALAYVDKTLPLNCDHAEMSVLRGHLYLEHGHADEARECFQEALRQSDSSPHILLRIAISVYDNNYIRLAYTMFRSLESTWDEDEPDGYSYMAACAHELGHREEYLSYLHLATERSPQVARNVLGSLFPEGMEPEDYMAYARGEYRVE